MVHRTIVTVQFLSASVFGIIMISRITVALRKRNETCLNMLNDSNAAAKSVVDTTRIQVTKMLIVNAIIFFICLTPLMLHSMSHFLYFAFGVRLPRLRNVILMSKVLAMLNSSINPVVYSMANTRYRAALVQVFRCRR